VFDMNAKNPCEFTGIGHLEVIGEIRFELHHVFGGTCHDHEVVR